MSENHSVSTQEMSMQDATAAGALAFFGDRYGDRVRVVAIDEFSKELCGGTHLNTTGQVGVFTVAGEGSVASGVRRIEALTGQAAFRHFKNAENQLEELAQLLKAPRERLTQAIERLKGDAKALQTELERLRIKDSQAQAGSLAASAKKIDGVQVLISEVAGADMAQLRQLADALKKKIQGAGVVCLGSVAGQSAYLVVSTSPDLVRRGVTSQILISKVASLIGGKGGGRPEFAQAGGNDPARLKDALNQMQTTVGELLRSQM
ncbi:MAG: hypothetical protein HY594_02685 [Candidatus Omnitrophica bacterium]|nr:hypothetical protein [Candidatus Omnitrophota bacterium]